MGVAVTITTTEVTGTTAPAAKASAVDREEHGRRSAPVLGDREAQLQVRGLRSGVMLTSPSTAA